MMRSQIIAGRRALAALLALGACSAPTGGGGTVTGNDAGVNPGVDVRTAVDARSATDGAGAGMDASAQCATATACGTCSPMTGCGWCGRTQRCLAGTSAGATDMSCSGDDWAWLPSRCADGGGVIPTPDAAAQCASATACGGCTAMGPCGWCGRTGRCMQGGSTGSADMSCTGADWAYTSNRCGADGGVLPPTDGGADCFGVPRACDLTAAGAARTCTAGQMVTVGCNAGCGLGSCTGDAVIQICPGGATAPCSGSAVVASNDDAPATAMCNADAGGRYCPLVTFMCPADGRYTVWTGAYDDTEAATCTVAVR